MIQSNNILKSSKLEGKFEAPIIKKLVEYFEDLGYDALPHARFNVSWGNILSDIDVLIIKDNVVGLIEVKSSRDNLKRARKQVDNIKDYVDFVYVATDYIPRKFPFRKIGWLYVSESVSEMKKPYFFKSQPEYLSVDWIPKKCLSRMCAHKDLPCSSNTTKQVLVDNIMEESNSNLKEELKEIVTCGLNCETDCPIWEFQK
ncbi:MAG: hypothetical protein ACW9W3_08745 [Candidatus Nitrosopumilus sp. bin_68KS]